MKGFIEIHTTDGKIHLVNVQHITEVEGSTVYTDEFISDLVEFPHYDCEESYEEIKDKIMRALR